MNENLRQALLRARLREQDIAARLGVDPKTVRRWIEGRLPYPANRAALADLLHANEADIWPEATSPFTLRTRPEEVVAITHIDGLYPEKNGPASSWKPNARSEFLRTVLSFSPKIPGS